METKTNDWEKQLKGALLLTGDEPIEVIFSGGVSKTIRQIPWSLFVATVEKLRADARKAERDICRKVYIRNAAFAEYGISDEKAGKEFDDVLATLREEEGK